MKKLIADLKRQIKSCKKFDVNPDSASWGYEEGVLLTANEAKSIVEQIEKLEAEKAEMLVALEDIKQYGKPICNDAGDGIIILKLWLKSNP